MELYKLSLKELQVQFPSKLDNPQTTKWREMRKTFDILNYSKLLFFCIGNSMVSRAIWKKHAQVSFSKTIKIARIRRTSAIWGLWKSHLLKTHLLIICKTKLCRSESYTVTTKKTFVRTTELRNFFMYIISNYVIFTRIFSPCYFITQTWPSASSPNIQPIAQISTGFP